MEVRNARWKGKSIYMGMGRKEVIFMGRKEVIFMDKKEAEKIINEYESIEKTLEEMHIQERSDSSITDMEREFANRIIKQIQEDYKVSKEFKEALSQKYAKLRNPHAERGEQLLNKMEKELRDSGLYAHLGNFPSIFNVFKAYYTRKE